LVPILTEYELEFLASLRKNWARLYWNELARLIQEDGADPRHDPATTVALRHPPLR
jgi:hypothetical protein